MMKRILVILCAVALVVNANAQEVSATYDPDVDGDNNIGVTDLLALLSLFSENDLDDDGIWDSQDDCVGVYDECGVCNGEGIPDGYADCEDFYGPCEGIETVLFDDYEYSVIAIGNQCWFAENLRTQHYTNGDAIPANLSDGEWSSTTSGAVAVYGEDAGCWDSSPEGNACDPTWSLNEYGRLYNWYAVDDSRGLCPTGWHVPTDEEWMTLEMELGMSEAQANDWGWRGTDQGAQMKTTYGWYGYEEGNGTNSSGFSGLPGGWRPSDGTFFDVGTKGYWWSSSPSGSNAWYRHLIYDNSKVKRYDTDNLRIGFSVRCLKDD